MAYKKRDDYIQQHISFCRKRHELEKELTMKIGEEKFNSFFKDYEGLKIKPMHVSRKASEHKNAVQVLENCIANLQDSEICKYHIKTEQVLTPEEYITMAAV